MIDRQRLILDCRQVNALFRAPHITELGSLPALSGLELPDGQQLFISGGDMKDRFYACRLPLSLRDSFCFSVDISIDEISLEMMPWQFRQVRIWRRGSFHLVWMFCLWDIAGLFVWCNHYMYKAVWRVLVVRATVLSWIPDRWKQSVYAILCQHAYAINGS